MTRLIIVGAGIAGLAAALALTKWLPEANITILEIRSEPSSIGGAVGLTPNAQRCLYHLGVLQQLRARAMGVEIEKIDLFTIHNGARLGQIDFTGNDGNGVGEPPFKGLRIMRADLVQVLTETVRSHDNIKLEYGLTPAHIVETLHGVTVHLEDGSTRTAELLLGCDGIHSFTRTSLVDPARKPIYTGIAAIFGFASLEVDVKPPWKDTGLCQSQRGSILVSHYESTRTKQYVGAVMETKDVLSRDGWVAKGLEQDRIKDDVRSRYNSSSIKILGQLIEATDHWTLYPVYKLAPKGKWCSQRSMLLGDAAHAMPPQGESAGYAIEDAILFARVMQHKMDKGLHEVFDAYQRLRRSRIDQAYDESSLGWETQKDCGWITFILRNWLSSVFLWWTATARQKRYMEDVSTMKL